MSFVSYGLLTEGNDEYGKRGERAYPMALVEELGQDTVQEFDLARGADELVVDEARRIERRSVGYGQ